MILKSENWISKIRQSNCKYGIQFKRDLNVLQTIISEEPVELSLYMTLQISNPSKNLKIGCMN